VPVQAAWHKFLLETLSPCNRVIGTEGRNSSAGSRRRGSSPPDSTSPFNVTLPGQAANCQSDDGGLGGDAWRDCSPNWDSGREVIGAPSPRTLGPAPLTDRALPNRQLSPHFRRMSTRARIARLARPGQASPVRSESNRQFAHDPASHPLNTLNTIASLKKRGLSTTDEVPFGSAQRTGGGNRARRGRAAAF